MFPIDALYALAIGVFAGCLFGFPIGMLIGMAIGKVRGETAGIQHALRTLQEN